MNRFIYKNFEATVAYDADARLYHGEVLAIRDVITFQAGSVAQIEQAFADSIEDYLAFCTARGEQPETPRA